MTIAAKATTGTLIQRDGGSGFNTIGEVMAFSGPGATANTIDVTTFESLAREFISDALPDGGEVTFDLLFVGPDVEQQGLRADCNSGTIRNYKVILNDHATTKSTFPFAAIVTKVDGPSGGMSEAYKLSITLKVSGVVTPTYAP